MVTLCAQTEVLPLVDLVASGGGNCCVMAYGATGSGKTHTLTGSSTGGLCLSGFTRHFSWTGMWTVQLFLNYYHRPNPSTCHYFIV